MKTATRFVAIMYKNGEPDIFAIVLPISRENITIADIKNMASKMLEWVNS